MTKMTFKNLPDKSTPITAENLNKLNNLAIGTTIEGHDEEVVLIKGENQKSEIYANGKKYSDTLNIGLDSNNAGVQFEVSNNLFDKNNVRANYRLDNSGNYYNNAGYNASENIKVLPNTTYSTSWVLSNMSCVCLYKKDGTFIQKIGDVVVKQFTTTNETSYIRVALTNEQLSSNVMLNKGSEELPYEPYVTPSIKVNNNGVYEDIYPPKINEWITLNSNYGIKYRKIGTDIEINMIKGANTETVKNQLITLGTLPGNCRPKIGVYIPISAAVGEGSIRLLIMTTGEVQIQSLKGEYSLGYASTFVRFSTL